MRNIRRILGLPQATEPDFLQFDQSFLRKKFYAVGSLMDLPSACVGPRAIRYSRGLELLELHGRPRFVIIDPACIIPVSAYSKFSFSSLLHKNSLFLPNFSPNRRKARHFFCPLAFFFLTMVSKDKHKRAYMRLV